MLDLNSGWFWALYTLAGSAVTVVMMKINLGKNTTQSVRDLYDSAPALKAILVLTLWATWPVWAVALLVVAVVSLVDWMLDLWDWGADALAARRRGRSETD